MCTELNMKTNNEDCNFLEGITLTVKPQTLPIIITNKTAN